MNFPIGFPEEEEKFRALGHHPSRYQLLVSTLKKRRLNEKPDKGLQRGFNVGEYLSDCHLNKQRLINSLGGKVDESAGLIEKTRTAPPYKISRILRGSLYAYVTSTIKWVLARFW